MLLKKYEAFTWKWEQESSGRGCSALGFFPYIKNLKILIDTKLLFWFTFFPHNKRSLDWVLSQWEYTRSSYSKFFSLLDSHKLLSLPCCSNSYIWDIVGLGSEQNDLCSTVWKSQTHFLWHLHCIRILPWILTGQVRIKKGGGFYVPHIYGITFLVSLCKQLGVKHKEGVGKKDWSIHKYKRLCNY